jgi:hypothetical protein
MRLPIGSHHSGAAPMPGARGALALPAGVRRHRRRERTDVHLRARHAALTVDEQWGVGFSPSGTLLAAANEGVKTISMFSVSSTGALTAVSGSPFSASGAPGWLAVFASSGNALTVSNLACAGCAVSTGVTTFSVASSGALTSTGSGTFSASQAFAFSPTGSTAVTTPYDAAGVNLQSVSTSGVLGAAQSLKTPEPVANIAFSAGGMIVAEGISRAVTVLVPSSTSSGTSWVGALGSEGYDLAGWDGSSDVANMPGVSLGLTQGSRYVWAPATSDVRVLESPNGSTREAATYFSPSAVKLGLTFAHAYTGSLHLYALDWDHQGRRETISVGGQTAVLGSDFSQGAWVTFPVSVAAGATVSIVVDRTAGPNAVLSGVLGDAPPLPGPAVAGAQGTLIPLYDNANPADWSEACSQTNGSGGGSLLIADVAEGAGPGSASVPAWANVIDRASVIGYVWTDYGEGGTASIAGIESEINAWYAYYPGAIAGIFFDGVSDDVPGTTTSNESFYRTLAAYAATLFRQLPDRLVQR